MSYRKFTYEDIAETFTYDPETGELWRRLASGQVSQLDMVRESGDQAERLNANNIWFRAYRIPVTYICFMLMTRRWPMPGFVIDHRNGNVADCRWSNLREGTPGRMR
jgi:HNH endonuclease